MAGPQQWCWPDGGALEDQPAVAVVMFEMLREAVNREIQWQAKTM